MIVQQSTIDQIRSKIRRRVLHLPVLYGQKLGEQSQRPLKKCPLREGDVRTLEAAIPRKALRERAELQPTAAKAVLAWIDLCQAPVISVEITVTSVVREGDVWIVRFEKGDWRPQSDRPVYLARSNDFTMIASKQTVKGDPELLSPVADDIRRARRKALEGRVSPEVAALRKQVEDADTCQRAMTNMKARNLVRRAQRNYEAAVRELLSDGSATLPAVAAPVGSLGEEDRPPSANTLATPNADSLESAA